ncbi:hypothetical protein BKA70DRAFT_1436088 [Coprinopsis sp. MPI-PUGE-AT-0042]|nr:hypothetical protein BKA70DRAFT_1436088 [Coprinopsis sp. MPI-PUGE-AT-0042]
MIVDNSFATSTNKSGFKEAGIVMDNIEELPPHVRVDDSYTTADEPNTTLLYDSPPPRVRVHQQEGRGMLSSSEEEEEEEDDDQGHELDVGDIPILPPTPISTAALPLPPSLHFDLGSAIVIGRSRTTSFV